MIKKLLLAVMIALPAFGFAQKLAVVNTQSVVEALPDMAAAQTQLENASKKYNDELKNLQDAFQKSVTEFQTLEKDASTPQSIKDRRLEELSGMQQKIEEFRATAAQDMQRQQEQLMAPIQQKIVEAIKAVGTEGGYSMVFENTTAIFTGADVEDVTAKVKARLGIK